MKRSAVILASIAVLGAAGWHLLDSAPEASLEYFTESVDLGDVRAVVTATGRVHAIVSVEVGSQLSGQLAELYVDFNDEVVAGQPIARLDDRSFKARVREAEARVQSARADVSASRARIQGAQARLAEARLEHQRAETLRASKQISASAMDRARAELTTARSEVAVTRAEELASQAAVTVAEAELFEASVNLERSVIRSPIDGVVIERQVDEGQTVAASLEAPTLFTIAQDLRKMKVDGRVDEADIGGIAVGQGARFTVDAFPGRVFDGRVDEIRMAPEEVNNVVTYTVVVTTDNPDLALLPGMTALMEIAIAERNDVLRVPNAALRYRPPDSAALDAVPETGNAVVWVPSGAGSPVPVAITTGISNGAVTALLDGPLSPGDAVVVGHAEADNGGGPFGIRLGF